MKFARFILRRLGPMLIVACAPGGVLSGQIPGNTNSGGAVEYKADGTDGQPFTVEVLDAHRTVGNTLLVRLAITNHGPGPLSAQYDFANGKTPGEYQKISGLYAVDPNGQTRYTVLRNADGRSLCSRLDPNLAPGERRSVFAQLSPPPETSSSVRIVFPMASPIPNVPIGLPGSGEANLGSGSIGDPGAAPTPAAAIPSGPPSGAASTGSNMAPHYFSNQVAPIASNSALKAVGSIQSGNSVVPFTVETLDLKRVEDGLLKLRLAITNNGSGQLDAAGQFTGGIGDPVNSRLISGIYLVDPVAHARYEVARPSETSVLCSELPPLRPGERRELEAEFAQVPADVTTAYIYFPHAAPISGVPVTQ